MVLFNRAVEIQVGNTKIEGLDISFDVEKSLSPEPNMAQVTVWNLNKQNRAYLASQKNIPVELKAGYEGNLALIFKGDFLSCQNTKEGPNWKTEFYSGDGCDALQNAWFNGSFVAGTSLADVVSSIAQSLKLGASDALSILKKSCSSALPKGTMLSGKSSDMLEKIIKQQNLELSVQDGNLQVLKQGKPLEREAVVLSPKTGLLESPRECTSGKIALKTLLLPSLSPGRKIALQNKFYRIEHMRIIGDSFGGEWCMEIRVKKKLD